MTPNNTILLLIINTSGVFLGGVRGSKEEVYTHTHPWIRTCVLEKILYVITEKMTPPTNI